MRRSRDQAALVKGLAIELGVSERQARTLRAKKDPRYLDYMSKMAAQAAGQAARSPLPTEQPTQPVLTGTEAPPPVTGIPGLDAEINRLSSECVQAHGRLQAACTAKVQDPSAIANAARIYTTLVESYRRIAKDTPGIEKHNNRLIEIEAAEAVWTRAAAELSMVLEGIPAAVESLVPPESAVEVSLQVHRKIETARLALCQVKLTPAV